MADAATAQKRRTQRPKGVKAKESYVRISASKVRPVLDSIRGKSYERAVDILVLIERKAGAYVLRCLESAVKNAENNNNLPIEELFVSECFADEGVTLRRWRARARGRATRIRKRTSTITIVVNRYLPEELEAIREKGESRRSEETQARRRRVQASQKESSDDSNEDVDSIEDIENDVDDSTDDSAEASKEAEPENTTEDTEEDTEEDTTEDTTEDTEEKEE